MTQRKNVFYITNALSALFIGACIYLFFRENTYFHNIVDRVIPLPHLKIKKSICVDFLRYYMVDALWAYSLVFSLSIFINEKTAFLLAIAFGLAWEILQALNFVKGTFDFFDILMYLTASVFAVLIIIKFKGEKSCLLSSKSS